MELTRRAEGSERYREARRTLLDAEHDLMRRQEEVAAMRRALPLETVVADYTFEEGPPGLASDEPVRAVKLSELFTAPGRSLVLYQFMYGKKQTSPCPMCTMWIDGFNAVAQHLAQRIDFAVVAAPPLQRLREHARSRDWTNLRLLADTGTFKYDFGSEDEAGNQQSTISVFKRDDDGRVLHFYTAHPFYSDEVVERGIDLLTPVWNMFDLTPEGRGEDWYPSVVYR